ncbi:membrane protein insertase YidC [bacterium]|nr:membrane protein insertase YidC [bacterium]
MEGMDKRTLIGLVLIALILILMPFYQRWAVGTVEKVSGGGDTTVISQPAKITQTPTDSAKATITAPETTVVPDSAAPDTTKIKPKKIYVHTDKYDAVLTNIGGDIISLKLSGIYDAAGRRVDMFPRPLGGPNFEIVLTKGNRTLSTAAVPFVADKDSIVLDEDNPRDAVTFVGTLPDGSKIQRRYEFENGTYEIVHKVMIVSADSAQNFDEGIFWFKSGLVPTQANTRWDIQEFAAYYRMGEDVDKIKPSKKRPTVAVDGAADWMGITSKYFADILLPDRLLSANGIRANTVWYQDSAGKSLPLVQAGLYYRIAANIFSASQIIYAGPRDYFMLKKFGRKLDKLVNLGWWWLAPITKIMLVLFKIIYKVVPNYGLVIIIFTLLMKILLLPTAHKQMISMKKMRQIQPELKSIQERYRDDPQKLNAELMKLYRKHGVSPLSGCLPIVFQMPIFFALYRALSAGFQFRAQSFLWIKDLAQQDPYYILPIIMAITMFIQQKISVTDPKQRTMVYIMPLLFLFFFYKLPAGLVLYWTVFNILSIFHMLWVEHKWVAQPAEAEGEK